jgi:hypothetical protein
MYSVEFVHPFCIRNSKEGTVAARALLKYDITTLLKAERTDIN